MYVTIEDRKRREAERRRRAVGLIAEQLGRFARERGGKYVLYGSAARGDMRHDSDIDLLVDFPATDEADAWRVAEDLAAEFSLDADIQPLKWCDPTFLGKILPQARIIP
ncbi:nucleotidyltransferase family protein [Jiella sp. M17.18]|uniref:nucleotidyltransferase family protein n=1 Tax=Jiella sp. M17.18 TaxID=3234247 RepID=UPI0034DE8A44